MSKWNGFFRGMAMLCLGIVIGFLIAPIKQGIRVSIGSNNSGSKLMNEFHGFDDEDEFGDEEYDDEPGYEEYDDEPGYEPYFETPEDDDVVPF